MSSTTSTEEYFSLLDSIKDVGDSAKNIILKLRVVRSYTQPPHPKSVNPPSFEMILHDRAGVRIHISLKLPEKERLKVDFGVGNLYLFRFFKVEENKMRYKTTESPYKITLTQLSKVAPFADDGFPNNMFAFRSFEELRSVESSIDPFDEDLLFDVMGKVVWTAKPKEIRKHDGPTKLVDIKLQDTTGLQLKCTIWGSEFVDEVINRYKDNLQNPLIVLIQFCRGKVFQGVVDISNTYHITNIIYNDWEIDEMLQFKNAFHRSSSLNGVSASTYSGTVYELDDEDSGPDLLDILATANFVDEKNLVSEKSASSVTTNSSTSRKMDLSMKKKLDSEFYTNDSEENPNLKKVKIEKDSNK